jgi:hypothetical protein
MTRGGPLWATETVATYVVKRAFHWLTPDESSEVVEEHVEPALRDAGRVGGHVRGDHDVRHGPQRMIRGQRLHLEHVEARPGDIFRPEGAS